MKLFKRIAITVCAAVFVFALVPASSFAVDPVSAATMANAFAQAITAYGASQGVSMTFDVENTDGIGEGVHDLWDQYSAEMAQSNVTVSDYSNLAASVFPSLWKKTFDYVTVSLDAATVGEIDGFWNWLLSGPAEMTKVDNEYYQWTVDSQSGLVAPIPVISYLDPSINGYDLVPLPIHRESEDGSISNTFTASVNSVYCLPLVNPNNSKWMVMINLTNQNFQYYPNPGANPSWASLQNGWYYVPISASSDMYFDYSGTYYPSINSSSLPYTYFGTYNSDNITIDESGINVRPYVGDAAPQDVYIPDNTDVNYTPVAAEIPLDILWDDSLFGDGTGSLTDAQSEAITEAADLAITDNPAKTLELADTDTPPGPAPGTEVYIPLLPVTLPSFNFSFSGIWHYVVTWVGSLGSWLTLMFSVWNSLPYAIVIPVYASAVVVIIIGTLKRFL